MITPAALPRWFSLVTSGIMLLSSAGFLPAANAPQTPPQHTDNSTHNLDPWSVEQMPGGSVKIHNGALVIEDAAGTTVWFRERLTAPVEISYEAEVIVLDGPHDRLSDLNCFWMAQDPTKSTGALPAGRSGRFSDYDTLLTYYVGYGGNKNTTTRFRRYDGTSERPLLPEHDLRDAAHLLAPNHAYQIRIVVRDGTTEYWRDGEKVFTFTDPHPLTSGYFAFRTVRSHLVIRNFKITRPTTSS